jgi:hypothetical protein
MTPINTFGHTTMLGILISPEVTRTLFLDEWPAGENTVNTPGQRTNANQTHPWWGVG